VKGECALSGFCAWSCCESGGESSEVKCAEDCPGGVAGEELVEDVSCIGESISSIRGLASSVSVYDMVTMTRSNGCLDGCIYGGVPIECFDL
jgi:hypothetical protein